MYRDRAIENLPKIVSLKQLKKVLQERTEKFLEEKFSWDTIETYLNVALTERIEDIMCHALGLEIDDSFGRRMTWKMKNHSRNTPAALHEVITDMVQQLAQVHLPKLLEDHKEKVLSILTAKKTLDTVKKEYEDAFHHALYTRVDEWAKEQAALDVEKIFSAENTETLLKEIQLKKPLVLHVLSQMAGKEEKSK